MDNGNAGDAIKAFGGSDEFKQLNHHPGSKWETEGNAKEALEQFGGVSYDGKTSSVKESKADVDTPNASPAA